LKIVIVGAGEVGFHFAQWLALEKKEIVVIDKNPHVIRWVSEHLDVQTLLGSGANPKILEEAGVKEADIFLTVTDSDEANLVGCFFVNLLAPEVHKVALIRNEDYLDYVEAMSRDILNISLVINPELDVVNTILRLLAAPDVEEVNDFFGGRIKLLGKHLLPESPLNGVKLMFLRDKVERNRMIIAALVREDILIIPKGTDTLRAGDYVYFVSQEKDLEEMVKLFGEKLHSVKNIFIAGGGRIGFRLAKELEERRYNVKLVERDPARCREISAQLHRTIVLQGMATDQELMEQENIGAMDMVIALTRDEEVNILTCLLSKKLGATKTVARVNKFAYMPLVQRIGIDHIVSPRLSAINTIFPYMRRGQVLSTVSVKGKEAEALEAVALPLSELVGTPLSRLKFPRETLLLCLMRGKEVLIPAGDTVIKPQDRVLILSTRENISRVEEMLLITKGR
jgi:trk/ktr system potassium uptake protein